MLDFQEMVPKKIFYTKGVGVHREKLASFEMALRVAGLAHCNLVLVSSIFPLWLLPRRVLLVISFEFPISLSGSWRP
jgi:pyruvoyl-dependent arginine decarboxylase